MRTFYFLLIATSLLKPSIAQTDAKQPLKIGDHYGGGIIFSLDATGQHGLIAAPSDLPGHTCWGQEGWVGAAFVGDGKENTEKIVAYMKTHRSPKRIMPAACACDTLALGGFSDWYLPSINELKEMHDKQQLIGGFAAMDYISSTESNESCCWNVHFMPKKKILFDASKYRTNAVRCIRKF